MALTQQRDLRTPSIVLGAVAVGTVVLAVRDPHSGGYGTCFVLALTGFQCATCGGLRTVHDLAHLDFAGAWSMNPLLAGMLPVLAILLVGWWWRAWRGHRSLTVPTWVVLLAGVVLLTYGVLRNLS